MPTYRYVCDSCERTLCVMMPYEDRETSFPCSCGGHYSYRISAPAIKSEVIKGDKRLIWDEKQIESSHGTNWRNEGANSPGGVGKTMFFDKVKNDLGASSE